MLRTEDKKLVSFVLLYGVVSVAWPGVARGPERTGGAVHGTGSRVEVTGFDGSPGVLDGFGNAVNPMLADVDIE